ncbi:MAG TPA: hydroxymethylglutaryl-CoA lyase [Kineosporiaceae bacterium]|nr:hydroxymethylglutaryl-CoA lyase [Kineosporiaceae bacterium]
MRVPGLPEPVTADGLPDRVTICEVGPRDGLQNESVVLPAEVKVEFVRRLVAAGLRLVEVTSFVRPEWVPQLADAEAVVTALARHPGPDGPGEWPAGLRLPVLVPNVRGLERALALGVRDVAVFASATQAFARRNLNRGWDEQFGMFAAVAGRARSAGAGVRGYLSMCFGDPWEGTVDAGRVVESGVRLIELGCDQLSLGDTIGVATPGQVRRVLERFVRAGIGVDRLAVHFHDTYGQALANTLAALGCGVTCVDASAGGLGGCPYARSATGNLATEDLVWMLDGLGVDTGVDLDALAAASRWMAGMLGRPSPSRVLTALTGG